MRPDDTREAGPLRPKRNPEVIWRIEEPVRAVAWEKARRGEEYEELGVLTLAHHGAIRQLNLAAAEIWSRINGVNTIERIASELAALFDADPAEMRADVADFLKESEERGWVVLAPAAPARPRWSPG